jgi:hypothetical protein
LRCPFRICIRPGLASYGRIIASFLAIAAILLTLWLFVVDLFKSRSRLRVENPFLRRQLNIALRRGPSRNCRSHAHFRRGQIGGLASRAILRSRTIAAQHKEKAPQTGLFRLIQICRNYMRESSDTPKLNAFCRVAPTLRFNAFAIFSAPVFFFAMVFKVRTFSPVQARLALFFIGSLPLCEVVGVSAEKAGVNAYGQFFAVDSRSTVKRQTNGRYLPRKLLEIAPRTLARPGP